VSPRFFRCTSVLDGGRARVLGCAHAVALGASAEAGTRNGMPAASLRDRSPSPRATPALDRYRLCLRRLKT